VGSAGFDVLSDELDVDWECFASPLNCRHAFSFCFVSPAPRNQPLRLAIELQLRGFCFVPETNHFASPLNCRHAVFVLFCFV
jgi:hypothetical protein